MMAVDASAVLAVVFGESDGARFEVALSRSTRKTMSAVNYWEVLVRARDQRGAPGAAQAEALLSTSQVEIAPVTAETARAAAKAFRRYGRRTAAGLNLGDCFAYALAQSESDGLLYKGDDFSKTDVRSALAP